MNNEIKEILEHLKNEYWRKFPEDGIPYKVLYMEERDLLLDYITNLQQEKEDNLKCIKSLKEQLESVIKNNQELLEKWHKNNDKIVNLISENERLKENNSNMQEEMARVWEENERLKTVKPCMLNFQECYVVKDYKSRCEKAIEYIKDNCSYEEDTKYCYDDLCSSDVNDLLNILQNGSDSQ